MSKIKYLPYALLALCHGVFAQQTPSAGSQMQQILPPPIPRVPAPTVDIRRTNVPPAPSDASVRVLVNSLRVTGAGVYSQETLLAITGFQPGTELSLADLRGMAAKIADFYHGNGYFLAQAYLPAQETRDGALTIAVMEGRYGKVILRNHAHLSDGLANSLLDGLNSGDLVTAGSLESRLLLLSDLPAVTVKSTLVPGASQGTSDLMVELDPGQRVSGSIDADNAGNRYTGRYRLGATINLNEPTGHGDVATLRAITSGSGLNYVRAAYQAQFGKAKAGASYSHLRYALGREFESLGAHGTANIASVFASYPLIRSRTSNLHVALAFDVKTFEDHMDSTVSVADKRARILTASLHGDHSDRFGGGGQSAYSLALSAGTLELQTPAVLAVDTATAQSDGHFRKLAFSAARSQSVSDAVSVYASVNGQIASKNLDVSEKMELGGMHAVRAYPEGEAYADEGYVLTLEARLLLAGFSERQAGQMQLIAFVDTGTVRQNKTPWAAGDNRRTLSGAGIGLNWTVRHDFLLRAYYARKVGSGVATSGPDASGRFWVQAVKYF